MNITEENFLLYCAKYYNNSCLTIDEFYSDIVRIKYLKKLFTRYEKTGNLKERLILNHIIVLNNVFTPEHATRILVFKLEEYLPYLKPFLEMLNTLPEIVTNLGKEGRKINTNDIIADPTITAALSKL